ncbi:hypothetical protein BSPA14S_B0015 (plasmid) [Borreliella spielmanii A14S]|uniref:Uncharacterized protein n=1 Tax=Borreliella spielmanii A14S TaxID=498742 RepID=C0RBW5_9SPIR|nr:hypothetical protein BSPA14S_B0015 [Borreliella spielmanii A14S]
MFLKLCSIVLISFVSILNANKADKNLKVDFKTYEHLIL